jgi:hypothetical protein
MCVSFLAKGLQFDYQQHNQMLLFTEAPRQVHPACYFMCFWGFLPVFKRVERESGHSPPSVAKDKDAVISPLHRLAAQGSCLLVGAVLLSCFCCS